MMEITPLRTWLSEDRTIQVALGLVLQSSCAARVRNVIQYLDHISVPWKDIRLTIAHDRDKQHALRANMTFQFEKMSKVSHAISL